MVQCVVENKHKIIRIKHSIFLVCSIKSHGFKSNEQAGHKPSIFIDSSTISANRFLELQAPWTVSTFCTKSPHIFYLRSLDRKRVSQPSRHSEFIFSKTVISFIVHRAAIAPNFPGLTTSKGTSCNCIRISVDLSIDLPVHVPTWYKPRFSTIKYTCWTKQTILTADFSNNFSQRQKTLHICCFVES